MIRRAIPLAALAILSACATVPAPSPAPVTIRVVGINDFHGNLRPLKAPVDIATPDGEVVNAPVGGAAWLAGAIASIRARSPYSMVVSAGDMIGASPLESAAFLDEPAIGVMNRIGVDFNAVGNHEFDKGWQELKRIQGGGCEKYTLREPCAVEPDYRGANFDFLAANVVTSDGETLFPAYGLKHFGKAAGEVTVGVIGLPLRDTPNLVTPTGVEGLTFGDEADAVSALIPDLEAKGADAIIVAIHQGLYTTRGEDSNGCEGVSGDLLPILSRLDPRVDLVISGHTHWAYVCDYSKIDPTRPFLVTSAGYGGSFVTDIALTIDPASGAVIGTSAHNIAVQSAGTAQDGSALPTFAELGTITPDPAIAAYVAGYVSAVEQAAKRPVGKISGAAIRPDDKRLEHPLADLVADAQLAATRSAGAQIAFMNNSGVRTSLVPAKDGTVTFGAIYAVQPFGNTLVTRSYTGAQLLALLEQQFDKPSDNQILTPSVGFAFAYDLSRPAGMRIVSASFDGDPIDPDKTYRVTMNSFLAAGGDDFTVFTKGTDSTVGGDDLDAMEQWLSAVPVRQLPALGRVRNLTPG